MVTWARHPFLSPKGGVRGCRGATGMERRPRKAAGAEWWGGIVRCRGGGGGQSRARVGRLACAHAHAPGQTGRRIVSEQEGKRRRQGAGESPKKKGGGWSDLGSSAFFSSSPQLRGVPRPPRFGGDRTTYPPHPSRRGDVLRTVDGTSGRGGESVSGGEVERGGGGAAATVPTPRQPRAKHTTRLFCFLPPPPAWSACARLLAWGGGRGA